MDFDDLPELGTKDAAVAGIESLIFRAIGAKDLEPLQLRYWLDAYYQARKAAELQDYYTLVDRVYMEGATPHQSPPATASPQGEAMRAVEGAGPYKVTEISEEQMREVADLHDYLHGVIRKAAKAAGIEIEEGEKPREEIQVDQFGFEKEGDGAAVSAPPEQADASDGQEDTSSVTAEAVTPSPQGEGSGPMRASAPTEAEERKPKQRPVGWTDGKLPTDQATYSGAAAAAQFKREQFERLQRFLRNGVTMKQIVVAADGNITEDQILGIRECRRVPVAVYRVLQAALDRVETI